MTTWVAIAHFEAHFNMTIRNDSRGRPFQVDHEDWDELSKFTWCVVRRGYVVRNVLEGKKQRLIYMHRVLMNAPSKIDVDHINGDKSDNRRSNLRLCTRGENMCNTGLLKSNTSGFKGVTWHKGTKKLVAEVWANGERNYLGTFETAELANQAARDFRNIAHSEFVNHGEQKGER